MILYEKLTDLNLIVILIRQLLSILYQNSMLSVYTLLRYTGVNEPGITKT